jgi:hypothetical protein
MAVKVA